VLGELFLQFPENNAIAIDYQETAQIKTVFKGHSDYLHCIVARNSRNQVYKLFQISRNTQRHSKAISILAMKHPRPFFMVALLVFLCIS
ncbi:hypothetical protein GIB67_038009, partial [Kingdonia uniflora]